jgi:hypothetical protein
MPLCHLEEKRVGHGRVKRRMVREAGIEQLHGPKYPRLSGYGAFWCFRFEQSAAYHRTAGSRAGLVAE